MKRIFIFTLLFFISLSSIACPFCGCGNSNFQVGILPTYKKAFIGVRYTTSDFNTLSHDHTQYSHDRFYSTEIWGGYQFGKLQVMAFVPWLQTRKTGDDGDINFHGLGDITTLANYKIFSLNGTNDKSKKAFSHALFVGGGIKFKTGKSLVDVADPDFTVGDFSSTPGTGSTDFLINTMYSYLRGANGLVVNATYRINRSNTQDFRYGNRTYFNAAVFHAFPVSAYSIRPSAGVNMVINDVNHYQSLPIDQSNGYIVSALAGVNVQKGNIGLAVNGFLPVTQNLYDHQTKFGSRLSAGLTYSF